MEDNDRHLDNDWQSGTLTQKLAEWYSQQPVIRRLAAVDSPSGVALFVTLDPTADGADSLPIWLSHQGRWTRDLRAIANRDVRLTLSTPALIEYELFNPARGVIADICWRDPFSIQ